MTDTARLGRLSRVTGRGFLVTFGFDALVQIVALSQGLLVPRLLGPENIGLFAVAHAVVAVGFAFKELGIHEKLVQERDVDLPKAYSVAFTLEVLVATGLFGLVLVITPVVAALYDRPELVPLIAVLGVTIYTTAFLNLPGALHLRRLDYTRQNVIAAVRPLVGFAVTVPLAFAGLGIWSLVLGSVAALLAAVAVVSFGVPLRPRLRLDRAIVRRYLRYGWPLWVANLLSLSTTWGGTFAISAAAGVSALGFLSVSQGLAQRAFRLDSVLARAIFPALCRARDDLEGQRRAFVATNRITAMWAGPIGFGLFLFAPDLVELVLGDRWRPGVLLFRMQGLAVAIGSIGYSWDVFFRARGETRPTLVFGAISEGWVFVVLLPAIALWGLTGAAWAVASLGVLSVVLRQLMVRRLFPGINLWLNAWRELLATAAAAALTAGARELLGRPQTLLAFAGQLGILIVVSGALVLAVDRRFIADLAQRVRGAPPRAGRRQAVVPSPVVAGPVVSPVVGGDEPSIGGNDLASLADRVWQADLSVPGEFPLDLAAAGDHVWVTCRDTSEIVRLDDGPARRWSTPAYPHSVCVDPSGRAWTTLALAGAVAVIDPARAGTRRVRLGRGSEPRGMAWSGAGCLVVDGGRGALCHVDELGRVDVVDLPPSVRRATFVAVDGSGRRWVTDRAGTRLAVVEPSGETDLVEVGVPTRDVVIDDRGDVWAGVVGEPAVVHLDRSGRVERLGLPAEPWGLAWGIDGRLWAAMPDSDGVVALDRSGAHHVVPLAGGSRPLSMTWRRDSLLVACSGSARIAVVR